MLKLSSTFQLPIAIDDQTVTFDIGRFPNHDAANDFLFTFDRLGKETASPDEAITQRHTREREHRAFVRESIEKYVSVKPGQLEDDGQPVTAGAEIVRAFAGRPAILVSILGGIWFENTQSQQMRDLFHASIAPFVPTPPEVIEAMLDAAGIGEDASTNGAKTVIDIGCGTGELLVAAAKRGAKAVGYEIHPDRAREALAAASAAGVSHLVHVHKQDVSTVPADVWRQANAVLMYLLPEPHKSLGAKLKTALLPGARVVCHAYPLGDDWPKNGTRYIPAPPTDNMTPESSRPPRIDSAVGWVYSYEVK